MSGYNESVTPMVEVESVRLDIVDDKSIDFHEASETFINAVKSALVHSLHRLELEDDIEKLHTECGLISLTGGTVEVGFDSSEIIENIDELIAPDVLFNVQLKFGKHCTLHVGNFDGGWVSIKRDSE